MRAVILLLALAAGCTTDTVISTAEYDQSCEEPNDCITVRIGDVCSCACELDAISYEQSTLYAKERSRLTKACDTIGDCEPCPSPEPSCDANVCTAGVQPPG